MSGGEKRRLYLLTILMQQPNMLVMDEPTNDLDIVTLNILEEYLKEFNGTLVIISHDRHFLDRLADHLFVFCGDGVVKDFTGTYSQYREFIKEQAGRPAAKEGTKEGTKASSPAKKETGRREDNARKKLTYKEQKELEQTEKDLESLNNEKETLENSLNSGTLSYEELQKASARIGEIMALIDEKETRWLELSC